MAPATIVTASMLALAGAAAGPAAEFLNQLRESVAVAKEEARKADGRAEDKDKAAPGAASVKGNTNGAATDKGRGKGKTGSKK